MTLENQSCSVVVISLLISALLYYSVSVVSGYVCLSSLRSPGSSDDFRTVRFSGMFADRKTQMQKWFPSFVVTCFPVSSYRQGQPRQTNHRQQLRVVLLRQRKKSQLGGALRSRAVKAFRALSATRATSISMSCEIT